MYREQCLRARYPNHAQATVSKSTLYQAELPSQKQEASSKQQATKHPQVLTIDKATIERPLSFSSLIHYFSTLAHHVPVSYALRIVQHVALPKLACCLLAANRYAVYRIVLERCKRVSGNEGIVRVKSTNIGNSLMMYAFMRRR